MLTRRKSPWGAGRCASGDEQTAEVLREDLLGVIPLPGEGARREKSDVAGEEPAAEDSLFIGEHLLGDVPLLEGDAVRNVPVACEEPDDKLLPSGKGGAVYMRS